MSKPQGRFVVTSVSAEQDVDGTPLDVETITATVELTWEMRLDTSTRVEIDQKTALLIGHLNLLAEECRTLDREKYPRTWLLLKSVDRHLAGASRAARYVLVHDAYHYMRDAAIFTSALLSMYRLAAEKQ
ncbi:hypothetical protein ACFYW9_19090 [Streptomyces sp. NPDC002698]|uniref:hypothetical protein n=1 Tax=Streptomyces sp. NPDC002698 TaxID=3364660 RepID=UPI0036B15409